METLLNISTDKSFRGMCVECNRKSFHWHKWEHVQMWHANHKCIDGARNSKNGYK